MSEAFRAEQAADFSPEAFQLRAAARLPRDTHAYALDPQSVPAGDHALNAQSPSAHHAASARPAAVLVPVVARPRAATLLLTQRAGHLRDHSGQIAFPGGKIDPIDGSPLAAALREAHEEIGLSAHDIAPLGYLDTYLTATGFRIVPIVALVDPDFALAINAHEVEDAFEAPLAFLMDPQNHQRHSREHNGMMRHYYAMPYGERFIWGVTAGIIRNLYERLYS